MLAFHRALYRSNKREDGLLGCEDEVVGVALACGQHIQEELHDRLGCSDARGEVFRTLDGEVCRILALRKTHRFHSHAALESCDGVLLASCESGAVGVEREHEVIGITLHKREVLFRERGARERHGIREAYLVQHEDVHLPLGQQRESARAYRVLGLVHTEQHIRLVEEFGLRRVQVFRRFFGRVLPAGRQGAAGERHGAPCPVAYREHETVAETVVEGAALLIGFLDEPCGRELSSGEAFGSEMLQETAPALGRVA